MKPSIDAVKQLFGKDAYASRFGIVLDDLTDDTVSMHMQLNDKALNWFGQVHGGVIYALADAAFSVLANNENNLSVALECSITYHASPEPGSILEVKGETLSATRRTAAYLFKVACQSENGNIPVATMKSVAFRTGKPLK